MSFISIISATSVKNKLYKTVVKLAIRYHLVPVKITKNWRVYAKIFIVRYPDGQD